MQVVGTSFGVAIVGALFFSLTGPEVDVVPALWPSLYGRAIAFATVYNVIAVLISFALFAYLGRNTPLKRA
jgi:hypothetical protein